MAYDSLTVAQLKEELKARNLTTSGLKNDLIKRLTEADAAPAQTDGGADAPARAAAAPVGGGNGVGASASAAGAAQPTEPATITQPEQQADEAVDPVAKRMQRFGAAVESDADRLKKREERFKTGDPINDEDKKSARADRFNIMTAEKLKEKELARAKRFAIETPEIAEEKKKARMERFSKPAAGAEPAPDLGELEAMINKRSK